MPEHIRPTDQNDLKILKRSMIKEVKKRGRWRGAPVKRDVNISSTIDSKLKCL